MNYEQSEAGYIVGSYPGPLGKYKCRLFIGELAGYQLRQYLGTTEYYISKNDGGKDLYGPYGSEDGALTALRFMDNLTL